VNLVAMLKLERARLAATVAKLDIAISALNGSGRGMVGGRRLGPLGRAVVRRRALSAAGRARIAAAQRARWAKVKARKK
jgi:hypothetical protein